MDSSADAPGDAFETERGSIDEEFHRLAQTRDLALAYELLSRLRPRLSRFLSSQYGAALGGEAGVEQVLGDALRKAVLKAFQFDPRRGSLCAWLFQIAGNTAVDEIADAGRDRADLRSDRLEEHPGTEPAEEHPLEALRRAIGKLPKRERVILKARYRRNPLPDRKLSEKLGCTVGHVHNVRSRVIKELREELREER